MFLDWTNFIYIFFFCLTHMLLSFLCQHLSHYWFLKFKYQVSHNKLKLRICHVGHICLKVITYST